MSVARLRHRVEIEDPVRTADDMGGGTIVWTLVTTVWASIETVMGNERKFGDKLEENVTHVITCRSLAVDTINTKMRIKFNNRTFQIHSIIKKDEIQKMTWISAIEGVAS
jgi:SPP1 family predicted phage head-tail adaptor